MRYTTHGTNGFTFRPIDEVSVLLKDTTVTAGDSNPDSADQKHHSVLLTALNLRIDKRYISFLNNVTLNYYWIYFSVLFQKAYKRLCLVLLYSALWTTIYVVLVNRHILPNYVRQTAYTNHCVQAGEGTICRDARLSGSPQDVNPTTPTLKTETITIKPTPKRIPQRWLGPKGYVTHDNKRVRLASFTVSLVRC